jgi:hypothetical protein
MKKIILIIFAIITFTSLFLFVPKSYAATTCESQGGSCKASCTDSENQVPADNCSSVVTSGVCCAPKSTGLGCGGGLGPFADALCKLFGSKPADPKENTIAVGNMFNNLISSILSILITVAGLWFLITFITAGFSHISAGGDKSKLQTARDKMLNAVEGLLIVAAAWVLALLIGQIVGINILNPGLILQTIGLK